MITIRGAPNAKAGLIDMINYISKFGDPKMMTMLEIGCYVGDSTEIFAQHFAHVCACDPWQNGYDPKDAASYQHPMEKVEAQFDEMAARNFAVEKFKMTSAEFAKRLMSEDYSGDQFDLVYIDGIHTYEGAKADIALFKPWIKPGGFLAGHDYQPRFPGVMKAVNEFGKPHSTFKDTSWIFRV
jgi:hypothetical protein